jgi:hypothetical protein
MLLRANFSKLIHLTSCHDSIFCISTSKKLQNTTVNARNPITNPNHPPKTSIRFQTQITLINSFRKSPLQSQRRTHFITFPITVSMLQLSPRLHYLNHHKHSPLFHNCISNFSSTIFRTRLFICRRGEKCLLIPHFIIAAILAVRCIKIHGLRYE